MSRMHRALALLALCLALLSVTTAAAAAPRTEDQNDRLLRSLQAQQTDRTQAAVALARSMERNFGPATGVEDQNDRLLQSLRSREAEGTRAAVALTRSGERNLAPAPASRIVVQPTATPEAGVDVFASLLLGLVGGLVGAGCAIIGWAVMTRRRPHHALAVIDERSSG